MSAVFRVVSAIGSVFGGYKTWTVVAIHAFRLAIARTKIYLRRPPGYGIGYTIGSLQMQRLLADRKRQLGDDFDLKAFHDSLMTSGRLPLSLLRWEMTGLDDEVKQFWKREPIPD